MSPVRWPPSEMTRAEELLMRMRDDEDFLSETMAEHGHYAATQAVKKGWIVKKVMTVRWGRDTLLIITPEGKRKKKELVRRIHEQLAAETAHEDA